MRAEKGGPKSRGFFHIFDWNKKSRKKLFSVSPESAKQEKRTDADLNGTKLVLVDEDEAVGISGMKESSDYSCASSVTDERNGIREPGVVARLMGLDSIPISSISEPCSTPFIDIRSSSHKRSPDFFINDQFDHARGRIEVHGRKPVEFRSQNLPSSPIERFQTETLPRRLVKGVPQIHHKLMSPIKNHGFVPRENAAHIMEAAAKILEPALPLKAKAKVSSYGPLKVCEPKDGIALSQRTSRVLDLGRRQVESSDMKYLRGQSLNRSWNGSEDRSSQDISDTNSLNGMGKGKSVSLAIQAKVNVQKREGLSINRKNASPIAKDVDEVKLNQPFKSQHSNHKIKQHKKVSVSGGSGVLRQNNQKQNCLSGKSKLTPKQSVSNPQERKNLYGDSSRKNVTTSKLSGNPRVVYRDETLETCSTEHEYLLSSNKNFPRKKRLTEGGFNSQRNSFVDNSTSKPTQAQPDVVIGEQSRWNRDNKNNGADVVSFTFNSPLVKSRPGPPFFIPAEENCDKRNICTSDSNIRRNDFTVKKIPSCGLNLITGDALSFLLEQKLRELTSGNESTYCNFVEAASSSSSIPLNQKKVSDIDSRSTNVVGHEKQLKPKSSFRDEQSFTYSCDTSSANGQVFGLSYNLQGLQEAEYNSYSNTCNEADSLRPSPLSILDASLSESSNSSLNSTTTNGGKLSLHTVQAQNIISKTSSLETELEQSYSSSSSSSSVGSLFSSENQSCSKNSNNSDLDYARDILNSRRIICAMDIALHPLDPLLFNKLENRRGKDGRIRRKMMFDCVNECLNSKCSHLLRSGYQAWASGEALMPADVAEHVYEEISRWKGFGDCMIDELVDRDMSSHRGRWVDFDTEAFELGMEIEKELINSLVDEVFIDIVVQD